VPETTFGARYRALRSAHERMELQRAEGRRASFQALDAAVDGLVLAALRGKQVIEIVGDKRDAQVRLKGVSEPQRQALQQLDADGQQERGAWYLPESPTLQVGVVHLAYWWRTASRYLVTLSNEERATVNLDTVDAMTVWAALEPTFEDLAAPVRLRSGRWAGRLARQQPAAKQSATWKKTVAPAYEALGVAGDAVNAFAPGTGWQHFDADAVLERRAALVEAWAHADGEAVARLRAYRIGLLVERYYAKAKSGRALRKVVMNDKDAQRILSAHFAGDWLAFLAFLGEQPHADEEVTRALPQTRLMVTSTESAQSAGAAQGVSPEEVQRILAAYWRQSEPTSPIELRVNALKQFWAEVDAIHAQQKPGMKELCVILGADLPRARSAPGRGTVGDHRLTAELALELTRLWATTLNPRFPEHLVTEPYPLNAAAKAFGPAFYFWDYAGTNAWHATEGGRAYKELGDEFERAVREYTEPLAALGCPIDASFFADLRRAEQRLGPIKKVTETFSEGSEGGIRITMSATVGERRSGYEMLRDVITHHRRGWAAKYMPAYVEARWKTDLQGAGEAYHRHNADRGRPPTAKQFAGMAAAAATNWFAGDLTAVYNVLGLRSPLPATTYRRCVPEDPRAFTKWLREALRAGSVASTALKGDVRFTNSVQSIAQHGLAWLAEMEVLGQPPELTQFSKRDYFKQNFDVLAPDRDDAWRIYCDTIQRVLDEPPGRQSAPVPPRVSMSRLEPRPGELADARAVEADSSANAAGTEKRRGLLKRLLGRP
jgi:hypothetical protein